MRGAAGNLASAHRTSSRRLTLRRELPGTLNDDQTVTPGRVVDASVRGSVYHLTHEETALEGVVPGSFRTTIAGSYKVEPKTGWTVLLDGVPARVHSVRTHHAGEYVFAWSLLCTPLEQP